MERVRYVFLIMFACIVFVACGSPAGRGGETVADSTSGAVRLSLPESVSQSVVTVEERALTDLELEPEEDIGIDNALCTNMVMPYKNGCFFYANYDGVQTDGDYDVTCYYEDEEGNVSRREDISHLFYVRGDTVFYTDEGGKLKSNKDGGITYDVSCSRGYPLCFAEDGIYCAETEEETENTSIYRADYRGGKKQLVCEMEKAVQQICAYRGELWFVYREPGGERERLACYDPEERQTRVYVNLPLTGHMSFTVQGGWLYLNSHGLKRLNVEENVLEPVYRKDAEGMLITEFGIYFFREDGLYRRSPEGIKKIKSLEGASGFDCITTDGKKLYEETYEGAFYREVSQIDEEGHVLRKIYGGP